MAMIGVCDEILVNSPKSFANLHFSMTLYLLFYRNVTTEKILLKRFLF